MSRRGDNIHKRSDGRWEGRYNSGKYKNGKAIYKSVYARSYAECFEKLKLARCDLLPEHKPIMVSELFSAWLMNRKNTIKMSTFVNYSYLYEFYLHKRIGARRVEELNAFMINSVIDDLLHHGGRKGEGLSARTVHSIIIMLRSALEYGEREYCLPNPSKNLLLPKADKTEIMLFNSFEIARIRAAGLNGDSYNLGVLLALFTGLRVGELCALTWGDFDLLNQTIQISKTLFRIKNPDSVSPKTIVAIDTPKSISSVRTVPIPSFILPTLSELKSKQSCSNYFLTCSSAYIEPRTYNVRYCSLLKQLGIPYRKFHSLRHTFATECIKSGVDVKSLSELLGHSSVKITLERYVHSDMELKRRELQKLYASV